MVAVLAPNKKLRRIVTIKHKMHKPVDFDVTVSSRGLTFRLPGTANRRKLTTPWHVVLGNVKNESSGYRIWSMSEAIAHLSDIDAEPEKCPCCGAKDAWRKK